MTLSKRIFLMAVTLLIVLGAGATLAQDNDGRPPSGPPGQMVAVRLVISIPMKTENQSRK